MFCFCFYFSFRGSAAWWVDRCQFLRFEGLFRVLPHMNNLTIIVRSSQHRTADKESHPVFTWKKSLRWIEHQPFVKSESHSANVTSAASDKNTIPSCCTASHNRTTANVCETVPLWPHRCDRAFIRTWMCPSSETPGFGGLSPQQLFEGHQWLN